MKNQPITTGITRDEFEDTLYNPDLVVVQKDVAGHLEHTQIAYVYENAGDTLPSYGVFRQISEDGTDYWKETYNA